MKVNYVEVIIITDPITADHLIEPLTPFAEGNSVATEQLGDPQNLNPTAMLPDAAVKFWFSEDKDSQQFRQAIQQSIQTFKIKSIQYTLLDSVDWTTEWRKNYKPIMAGNQFVILPPWEENSHSDRTPLLIDPGAAFGTGQHETTRLCLAQLEQHVKAGMHILDLGAGSAILSMACAHLGAKKILALEIDGDAVHSAQENLKLNNLEPKIELVCGGLEVAKQTEWDLVVANILAVILIELIQNDGLLYRVKPGGCIIFSGIINQQLEQFKAALDKPGFTIETVTADGEWVAVTVRRTP